jgi:hypothetical protein
MPNLRLKVFVLRVLEAYSPLHPNNHSTPKVMVANVCSLQVLFITPRFWSQLFFVVFECKYVGRLSYT